MAKKKTKVEAAYDGGCETGYATGVRALEKDMRCLVDEIPGWLMDGFLVDAIGRLITEAVCNTTDEEGC